MYISGIRLVAKGHKMVDEGWALFEKTAEEMAPGELRQLLRSLKMTTTPPPTPMKMKEEKEEGEEQMEDESGPSKIAEKLIYVKLGGTSTSTDAVTVMLPQCDQNMGWMHTSAVCTQRMPYCVRSACFQHTISILSQQVWKGPAQVGPSLCVPIGVTSQ